MITRLFTTPTAVNSMPSAVGCACSGRSAIITSHVPAQKQSCTALRLDLTAPFAASSRTKPNRAATSDNRRGLQVFSAAGDNFDKVQATLANRRKEDAQSPLGPPPPADRSEGPGFVNASRSEDYIQAQLQAVEGRAPEEDDREEGPAGSGEGGEGSSASEGGEDEEAAVLGPLTSLPGPARRALIITLAGVLVAKLTADRQKAGDTSSDSARPAGGAGSERRPASMFDAVPGSSFLADAKKIAAEEIQNSLQ